MVEANRSGMGGAANQMGQPEMNKIYRQTILGNSLNDILDEMIRSNDLQDHQKDIIMQTYDREILESFHRMPKPQKPIKVSGSGSIYNEVEEFFRLNTKDFELKGEDGLHERVDNCIINSINAQTNPIEPCPLTPKSGKKKKGGRHNRNH